jgi:UDP-N-acetylmuramate--alanine ligase
MHRADPTYQNYFFIGIGGIGMSALARYFKTMNRSVSGYDRTRTPLTHQLEKEHITVMYDEGPVQEKLQGLSVEDTLVVYSAAFRSEHPILKYAEDKGLKLRKRAYILGELSKKIPTLAVAGTHGKTTTSAILTHILKANKLPVTAIIGGVLEHEDTNFIHQGNDMLIVEADEFDRSFLQLSPLHACIISTDADHIDTYATKNDMQQAFRQFHQKVKGSTFISSDTDPPGIKLGFENENTPVIIKNVRVLKGRFYFDLSLNNDIYEHILSPLPGKHNIQNTAFAIALAYCYRSDLMKGFISSLKDFMGIKRRFNVLVHTKEQLIIDDYAHHPEAIKAVHNCLREMFPDDEQAVFFQPHLYSRTQQFEDEFAEVLSLYDAVYLLPIYPAREEPVAGVSSQNLLDKVKHQKKYLIQKEQFIDRVNHAPEPIKAILGAGDIGQLVGTLKGTGS